VFTDLCPVFWISYRVAGAALFDASLLTPLSRFFRGSFFAAGFGVNLLLNKRLILPRATRIFAKCGTAIAKPYEFEGKKSDAQ
jgi:hypothetical protein